MTREEAIKEIKSWDFLNKKETEAIETLIPELRESEDERIRKALIDALKTSKSVGELKFILPEPTREECLAYLEKQKEQKPAEWSEDWREEDIQTRFAFYTYKDDPSVLYLSNVFVEETSRNHGFGTRILRAAEKVAETIGATTISLKVKQDSPANAWYRKNGYGYVAFEDGYDWLEKNLEYMKPNKQEWSEEDEEKLSAVISLMKSSRAVDPFYDKMCLEDWLKSLKNRGNSPKSNTNSPSWKPSEEQMCYLKKVYESYYFCDGERTALESLYNDLQKLLSHEIH